MTDWGRHRNIFRGIVRLAQFNSEGLLEFGDTSLAFLNSLAPLLAFPLLGAALALVGGAPYRALVSFLLALVLLLAPPVLSHLLAVLWHRESLWPRFAVAFNWCAASFFFVGLALVRVIAGKAAVDPSLWTWKILVVWTLFNLYWAFLTGFLTRRALRVSIVRSIVMVVFVNFGTILLVGVPVALLNVLTQRG
jgi:hypothetical protein